MILDAGRFLHMKRFDWVKDDITPSQFVRTIPVIYAAWSSALPNSLDKVEELAQMELQICINRLEWERDSLLTAISYRSITPKTGVKGDAARMRCSRCEDDYTVLGCGLVNPEHIAFTENVKIGLKRDSACTNQPQGSEFDTDACDTLLIYLSEEEDSDIEEEFFDAHAHLHTVGPSEPVEISLKTTDPFLSAATMLYRAQGRVWLGEYSSGESYCATYFLLKERYIGEDGLGTDNSFPVMPSSFEMLRADEYFESTFDGVSN
jgi:hypothetical protein